MQPKTVLFIGHRESSQLKESVVKQALLEFLKKGYSTFLCGGMGQFDWLCARLVSELKDESPEIQSYLIIPYLTFSIQNSSYFDDIIYPEGFEQYHFKSAILKRNQYMVKHADAALCYVNYSWGGAAKTYTFAQKQGLYIRNLGQLP